MMTPAVTKNDVLVQSVDESVETEQPSTLVRKLLFDPEILKNKRRDLFAVNSNLEEWMENYDMEKITAIRENNLEKLRFILENGGNFNACNRNGETILHLACRRGNLDVVRFLVDEAQVEIEVQDDLGRSVLHDICWRPYPDFELMEFIMGKVPPAFLLTEDRRGHTCFDYCRKQDWNQWNRFLHKHARSLQRRASLYNMICQIAKD
jgi:ankyrin repeat protein